jgi:phage terminase small subunit
MLWFRQKSRSAKALGEKLNLKAESVLKELALVGFSNMADYMDLSDPECPKFNLEKISRDHASVISELVFEKRGIERRVKLKLHDKLQALITLGKHLGLFSERHLLGGIDGGEIKHTQFMEVVFVESKRSL